MRYVTFQDVIDHGLDYLGSNPTDSAKRDCVRAALEAYRDLANAHNWTYLYSQARIITDSAYDSSVTNATIAYQHTGGTYERQCTISGDVWPSWASDSYIKVGEVSFRVDERKSATIVTLDPVINPGADIASGTEFILYRDTYLLPEDYISQDQALFERNFGGMEYTHPREWLYENRYVFAQGVPEYYTITGDNHYPGRLVIRIFPWPYETKSIDFLYKRRPSALLTTLAKAGTVTATSGSNTINGVGTNFTPGMVGSVIRLSSTATPPTSLIMGGNIAAFESFVSAWVSPTQVVIEDPVDMNYTTVGYTVSDMVDIEQGAMLNAYYRCVEKHLSMSRTLKDKPSAAKQYDSALSEAKSADSRSFMGRSVGPNRPLRRRLRDYPIDLTQTT